jgi:hypothetical protein
LHAEEAVEGPFSVVLHDRLEVWRLTSEALVGYDMLAGVVALLRARPEKQAVLESCTECVSGEALT